MDAVTEHVLSLRSGPPAAALRRGGSPATARYAYPYLAWVWQHRPYLKQPALLFASLAAIHRDLPQRDLRVAHHLQQLARADNGLSELSVERRLLLAVNADLTRMHDGMRSLLASTASQRLGIDFDDLWRLYRNWDHPDRDRRDRLRDRLLEEFYQPQHDPTHAPATERPKL